MQHVGGADVVNWTPINYRYVMDALPDTTARAPTLPALPLNLTRRQESYARCVAGGMSYAEAFRQAGCVASTSGSQSHQISELNRNPKVRARIIELKGKADEETVDNLKERMAWLRLIISADPAELSRIVTKPCGECWPDSTRPVRLITTADPLTVPAGSLTLSPGLTMAPITSTGGQTGAPSGPIWSE